MSVLLPQLGPQLLPLHVGQLSPLSGPHSAQNCYWEAAPISKTALLLLLAIRMHLCLLLVPESELLVREHGLSVLTRGASWLPSLLPFWYLQAFCIEPQAATPRKGVKVLWIQQFRQNLSVSLAQSKMRGYSNQEEHMSAAGAEELLALMSIDAMVE